MGTISLCDKCIVTMGLNQPWTRTDVPNLFMGFDGSWQHEVPITVLNGSL